MSYQVTSSGLLLPNSVKANKNPAEDFDQVEIFARNGFVCFNRPTDDGSDMQFKQTNVKGAKIRYVRMANYADHCRKHESKILRDKVPALERFLVRLKKVIEQAEEQGPFEHADMRRARVRSTPTSVSFSGVDLNGN